MDEKIIIVIEIKHAHANALLALFFNNIENKNFVDRTALSILKTLTT